MCIAIQSSLAEEHHVIAFIYDDAQVVVSQNPSNFLWDFSNTAAGNSKVVEIIYTFGPKPSTNDTGSAPYWQLLISLPKSLSVGESTKAAVFNEIEGVSDSTRNGVSFRRGNLLEGSYIASGLISYESAFVVQSESSGLEVTFTNQKEDEYAVFIKGSFTLVQQINPTIQSAPKTMEIEINSLFHCQLRDPG